VAEKYPRMSQTLPGPRAAGICQGCGRTKEQLSEAGADLVLWVECDDADQPTEPRVYVQLCTACDGASIDDEILPAGQRQPGRKSKQSLIDAHPRLYKKAIRNSPTLGAMALCMGCKWERELRCTCPMAKGNGGDGMLISMSQPSVMFMDGTDKAGRRVGWKSTTYSHPPRSCAGREIEEVAE
jgi:hypothetical protein